MDDKGPHADFATANGNSGPQITLITKRGLETLMSKKISIDGQGKLNSDGSHCLMALGTASRAAAATASDLAEIITNCRSDQAIALGTLEDGLPDSVALTVPSRIQDNPDAITRSRNYINYRSGIQAWCLVDYDTKGMPDQIAGRIADAGGMWGALLTVAPGLVRAARVSRASTSSGLFRTDTGEAVSGSSGEHHYIAVADGSDIERFLKDLHDRCWLHGFGWHTIGRAGQLLERSPVDRMVGYGERLCFEGAPRIILPLQQDTTKRVPQAFEGEAIDARVIAPRLTEYERHRVNEAKVVSAEVLGKSAAAVRSEHDKKLAEEIADKSGMPIVTALRLVTARHRGVIFPNIELEFDHLGTVAVGAVLADPARFIGETLADPMEGVAYGRGKAMVLKGDNGTLLIHSFAHGRGIYFLRLDLSSAKAAFAQAPAAAMVDHAMVILAQAELEADELADFVASVSKAANVGIRALMSRVKKERAEREATGRRAAIASNFTDGRIVRSRPEPDGELLPTVTFLDELLAADRKEEPPMRNASGALVQVEVRVPWALHLLTADSANSAGEEPEEPMKPPAEPLLAELTPTGVELLLEHYVRWIVYTKQGSYFGALPGPFIKALIEYSPSAIPVARAINTGPLVTMSGRIMTGVGLDRNTGLIHRIDPVLRSCLPADRPGEQEIKEALKFLLEEWLVDVALDATGKCVVILLALTVLERTLLPERPAFFVTAGQRGGGKTTLVHMIMVAILGRRAAAAAWSDNAEERKKALFSYLRQGVAALVWDNIARGTTISCPHIEAALTAPEISDRILGVSRVETVSAATVQIFTGNSIAPRGDMASRSFQLPLDVNRPDPENRDFRHPDPLAWTQANRPKILRALYTILVGGAVNRPRDQSAKTRFKVWWSLIGWTVEYAASLLDIAVDCTELMRTGEFGEEEASAAARVLTILREYWGDNTFATIEVVLALAEVNCGTEETVVRAEALSDALGELIGKTLEKPTARSLGKLFQKHLTNRPAWIDTGNAVATLRRIAGHETNHYKVQVSVPGQSASADRPESADVGSFSDANHPLFPDIPDSPSADGKVGKEGNVFTGERQVEMENPAGATGTPSAWKARI